LCVFVYYYFIPPRSPPIPNVTSSPSSRPTCFQLYCSLSLSVSRSKKIIDFVVDLFRFFSKQIPPPTHTLLLTRWYSYTTTATTGPNLHITVHLIILYSDFDIQKSLSICILLKFSSAAAAGFEIHSLPLYLIAHIYTYTQIG